MTAVELDEAAGHEAGKVIRRTSHKIPSDRWMDTVELLDNSGFWESETSDERPALDGARWVLEASIGERYHVVQRTPSNEDTIAAYRGVCLWLLDIAGIAPPGDELY